MLRNAIVSWVIVCCFGGAALVPARLIGEQPACCGQEGETRKTPADADSPKSGGQKTVTCYLYAENSQGMSRVFTGTATENTCGDAVSEARQDAKQEQEEANEEMPGFEFNLNEDETFTCGDCENDGCPPAPEIPPKRFWEAKITVKGVPATRANTRSVTRRFLSLDSALKLSRPIVDDLQGDVDVPANKKADVEILVRNLK